MAQARTVVVITGASAGVGRATARRFADEGAAVALLARGPERLEEAAHELRATGSEALPLSVDVADEAAVDAAAARVEDELGPIDVWVNNAMVTVYSPVAQLEPDELRRVTEVTYLGSVWGTMTALARMRPRNRGTIVQVGSALAYRAIPVQSAYCAAKHALRGFLESLRAELLHDGLEISVSEVHLPALNTPQFQWGRTKMPNRPQPVPPIFQPEVAAEAIVWVAKNPQRELWVGWPTVQAILGDKVAPGLLDRYLARTGYDSQQTGVPVALDRPDNLFEPVPGDFGAHGPFDNRAQARSLQLWLSLNRRWLGLAALSALAAGAAAARRRD